jgi:hypothetical protein
LIQQPERAELPAQLCAELLENTRQSILDGVRLGEGPADGVLNEQPAVEVFVLMKRRGREK